MAADMVESGLAKGGEDREIVYRSGDIVDVLRNTIEGAQVTADSKEISEMVHQLIRFQQAKMGSSNEMQVTAVLERVARMLNA